MPTFRVITTGDWNAGAQPGADGRHHALGEEENYFKVQEQRNECVSSRQLHFPLVALSDVLWFLIAGKLYGNVDFVEERHRHRFEVEATERMTDLPSIRSKTGRKPCSDFPLIVFLSQVNPEMKSDLEKNGLQFVGQDVEGERMEVIELEGKWQSLLWGLECNLFNGWLSLERASSQLTHLLVALSGHCYFVGVQYHPEFTSRPIKPSPPYFGLLLASAGKLQSYLAKGCQLSPRYERPQHRFVWTYLVGWNMGRALLSQVVCFQQCN